MLGWSRWCKQNGNVILVLNNILDIDTDNELLQNIIWYNRNTLQD